MMYQLSNSDSAPGIDNQERAEDFYTNMRTNSKVKFLNYIAPARPNFYKLLWSPRTQHKHMLKKFTEFRVNMSYHNFIRTFSIKNSNF